MEQEKKKRRSPPPRRKITHQVGAWSWNHDNLLSKLDATKSDSCNLTWQGSTGPETHLYGGFKNGVAQMNQARRFLWMGEKNQDIALHRITMTCNNPYCMNIEHMKLAPNLKLFKSDGITPSTPKDSLEARTTPVKREPKPKPVKEPKPAKIKLIKPSKSSASKGTDFKRPKVKVENIDLTSREEQW